MKAPLELADILHRHGLAYRHLYADSLDREQYRVMRAIEQCRTAALGGHVEECDACGHQRIAYNSCGNRHCPKCQSFARAEWLDRRQADLLHVHEFLRRFLLHVLARGLQWIRHYGLLSNRLRVTRIAACRHLLGAQPAQARTTPRPDYRDRYAQLTGRSLRDCPVCRHGHMICIACLLPGALPRAPPNHP
ncbi:transposase zinc-binding domain-containing protein [Paraburkholderia youngii]|uniref:transposase zinc-binding domain-containing protein n=1 Tax=Paraburkholderia youngii TaxID=2782701 RepID=UPI003D2101EE